MADWLPAAGVEDRRWRRWMAHLLVTEALVWSEAGVDPDNPDLPDVVPTSNGSHPDEAARLEAAARTLFDRVTSNVVVSEDDIAGYYHRNLDRFRYEERRVVSHVLTADAEGACMARTARRRRGHRRRGRRPPSIPGPGTVAAGSARCGVGRWLGPSRMRSSPAPRGACSALSNQSSAGMSAGDGGDPRWRGAVRGGALRDRGRPAQRPARPDL